MNCLLYTEIVIFQTIRIASGNAAIPLLCWQVGAKNWRVAQFCQLNLLPCLLLLAMIVVLMVVGGQQMVEQMSPNSGEQILLPEVLLQLISAVFVRINLHYSCCYFKNIFS